MKLIIDIDEYVCNRIKNVEAINGDVIEEMFSAILKGQPINEVTEQETINDIIQKLTSIRKTVDKIQKMKMEEKQPTELLDKIEELNRKNKTLEDSNNDLIYRNHIMEMGLKNMKHKLEAWDKVFEKGEKDANSD